MTTVRHCAELLDTALHQSSDASPISGGVRERLEVLRSHVKTAAGFLTELADKAEATPTESTTEYTIELKGPVDVELYNPNVAHDEVNEDPDQDGDDVDTDEQGPESA